MTQTSQTLAEMNVKPLDCF